MNSCYIVMRHTPDIKDERILDIRVEALTANLHLAERVIANYYTNAFGEDGETLICVAEPNMFDCRTYWMKSNYEKKGSTYFTVQEEEIKDYEALL